MKASAALLAGLLAGLALGGVSQAQPPALAAPPQVIIIEEGAEEPAKNPTKRVSPKAARCALDCQGPTVQCTKRCGREAPDCMEACGTKHTACMKKCGVDIEKLREEADS